MVDTSAPARKEVARSGGPTSPASKNKLRTIVHSPSSISTALQCRRKWWLRYREGIKQPEFTWSQVLAHQAWERLSFRQRIRTPEPPKPVGGQRSTALGKEVHRLAEIYLTVPPKRVRRRGLIDWTQLPGMCLAELVRHLPSPGSLTRKDVERNVSVVTGEGAERVSWRGVIDIALPPAARAALESYDHKTCGDIRAYALLSPRTAARIKRAWRRVVPERSQRYLKPPARDLRNDLQACLYVLARGADSASDGLCRWNYTETKRARRSLPVVAYVPIEHARAVIETHARTAREVAAFKTIDDATPNTLACDEYGGCWYRIEGHCKVRRHWGQVFLRVEAQQEEREAMAKLSNKDIPKTFKDLTTDTTEANEAEERAARKAAKRKAAEAEAEEEDDEETEEAPESEPAPKPKASKRKPAPEPEAEDDDEEEAPESEPAPKAKRPPSPRAAAQAQFDRAVPDTNPKADLEKCRARLQLALGDFVDALCKSVG